MYGLEGKNAYIIKKSKDVFLEENRNSLWSSWFALEGI